MTQKDDPTIERVRQARHEISQEHNHNPQELVKRYLELQKKYEARILNQPEQSDAAPIAA